MQVIAADELKLTFMRLEQLHMHCSCSPCTIDLAHKLLPAEEPSGCIDCKLLNAGHVYTAGSWHEIHEALFDAPPTGDAGGGGAAANDAAAAVPVARAASPQTPSPSAAAFVGARRSMSQSTGTAASSVIAHAQSREHSGSAPGQSQAAGQRDTAAADAAASECSITAEAAQNQEHSDSGSGVPRVLVVAGSDSGGGAGIQADIKACMACGAFASTAITALTEQNSRGVHGAHMAPVDSVRAQMSAVLDDIGTSVMKTGMLPSAECVSAVADAVQSYAGAPIGAQPHGSTPLRRPQLVVDPVMVSTSGHSLAATDVCGALRQELVPLATVLTPNIEEAAALLGAM